MSVEDTSEAGCLLRDALGFPSPGQLPNRQALGPFQLGLSVLHLCLDDIKPAYCACSMDMELSLCTKCQLLPPTCTRGKALDGAGWRPTVGPSLHHAVHA